MEPPSAGFVIQLFVIPAAVVVVVIIVWLLFGKLAGGERDAMEYVRSFDRPAPTGALAFELASLIQHDAKIGSDPLLLGSFPTCFLIRLDQPDADPQLTQYLALTLGAFRTLEAKTSSGRTVDPLVPLERALEMKYPTPTRIAAAASLAKQAARLDGKLDDEQAVKALGGAAATGEAETRQMAVYALGFFGGDAATEISSGSGRMKIGLSGLMPPWHSAPRRPRGPGTLQEMLSTNDLSKVIDVSRDTEKQNKIEAIELEAMGATRTSISGGSTALAKASAAK